MWCLTITILWITEKPRSNYDNDDDDDDEIDNNAVHNREAEFQAWKRRKEYDPLAAARLHLYLMVILTWNLFFFKNDFQRKNPIF